MTIADTSAAAVVASAGHLLWPEPEWIAEAVARGWEWARTQWRRAACQPGAWFDAKKADAAVALFPRIFRLTEDRFAGKPFKLSLWQEIIVRMLIGWKVPVEIKDDEQSAPRIEQVRLFRRLLLWVPRKNGKSEFLAALALLFFVLDGVVGGQGFAFARDEKQARIVFDKMKAMIAMSPAMADKAQGFKKSIWIPKIRSVFELLTGKPEGKHGRSPTVIVGDEMHEWESAELASTLRQGTGARLEPIELYASTAGLKSNPTGWALWEESVSILDGRIDDPTSLVVIFAAEQEADWQDEANWPLANPSLGISPTMAFLRREAALAVDNPRAESHFRCYHLNQWIDAVVRWLNMKKWDACTDDKQAWHAYATGDDGHFQQRMQEVGLAGRQCFGAFDISSTDDITALMWVFPPDGTEKKWRTACRFWVPEDNIEKRVKQDRVSYDKWQKAGALIPTPGDYVDQDYVKRAIIQGLDTFEVAAIGYDPWNATKLYTDLVKEGVSEEIFLKMRQGHQTLGEPTKFLEHLVTSGKFDHGGHPVLRWMAGNTSVRFDENLNFMPTKKRSAEKIDGIVAAVMACGLAIATTDRDDLSDFLKNPVTAQ
ncbi:MAG TPA: terminase TerL endonuclease subunit [Mesorhizobium sp.]|jgi:phage terminase large subunit-like protein|uniref:terminase large subunit n=1 Tax=Mesorhizobium sp. TaxID=1871066 RepID=UPI002DDD6F19|nr:terminase TerL endonuclease subunit [Mesorhizobium sp.]HEV2502342.1 terminase TerL endonuclease subunit [Mesorhizobium sp.]